MNDVPAVDVKICLCFYLNGFPSYDLTGNSLLELKCEGEERKFVWMFSAVTYSFCSMKQKKKKKKRLHYSIATKQSSHVICAVLVKFNLNSCKIVVSGHLSVVLTVGLVPETFETHYQN